MTQAATRARVSAVVRISRKARWSRCVVSACLAFVVALPMTMLPAGGGISAEPLWQSQSRRSTSGRSAAIGSYRRIPQQKRKGLLPLFQSFSLPNLPKAAAPRQRVRAPIVERQPVPVRTVAPAPATGVAPRAAAATAGGRYRTMCVRMCDGYYFPISFRTSRSGFEEDEKSCAAACEAPAKLFYYANPGEEPEAMRDLDGQPYRSIDNAFRYRKEFVADCRCRPEPWTEEARQRHAALAAEEAGEAQPEGRDDVVDERPSDEAAADTAAAQPDIPELAGPNDALSVDDFDPFAAGVLDIVGIAQGGTHAAR